MTVSLVKSKSTYIFLVLALLILTSNLALMNLDSFKPITDVMALATVLDLTICLPLAFYIFIVRNRYSPVTVLPVVIVGFWVAYLIVPHESFQYFREMFYVIYGLEALFIAIELYVLFLLIKKARAFRRNYLKYSQSELHFRAKLRKTLVDTFDSSRMIEIWVTDISVFHYGLFNWRRKWIDVPGVQAFSYHKNTGYFGLFIMLVHAMAIEVIAVHALVAQWNTTAAWIVTALDIYLLLCIIADYHAIRLSPVLVDKTTMKVQMGVRSSLEVELNNIQSIDYVTEFSKEQRNEKGSYFVTLPEFIEESPQFEIQLKEPVIAHYVFGIKKEITKIYATVDDRNQFYELINEHVSST